MKRRRARRPSAHEGVVPEGVELPKIKGELLKLSKRGTWQPRYFYIKGCYLHYAKKAGGVHLGAIEITGKNSVVRLDDDQLIVKGLCGDIHDEQTEVRPVRIFTLKFNPIDNSQHPSIFKWNTSLLAAQVALRAALPTEAAAAASGRDVAAATAVLLGGLTASSGADAAQSAASPLKSVKGAEQLFQLTDARFADLHEALIVAGEKSEGDDDTIDKISFVTTTISHLLADATPARQARAKVVLECVFDAFVEYAAHIHGEEAGTAVLVESLATGFQRIWQHGDAEETCRALFDVYNVSGSTFIAASALHEVHEHLIVFANACLPLAERESAVDLEQRVHESVAAALKKFGEDPTEGSLTFQQFKQMCAAITASSRPVTPRLPTPAVADEAPSASAPSMAPAVEPTSTAGPLPTAVSQPQPQRSPSQPRPRASARADAIAAPGHWADPCALLLHATRGALAESKSEVLSATAPAAPSQVGRRGSTLLFGTQRGRTVEEESDAAADGYHRPATDDVVAIFDVASGLYATAAAKEVKLKAQGRLLDPRCLFRVTHEGKSSDNYDTISLRSVVEKHCVGFTRLGNLACAYDRGGSGTSQPNSVFTAVTVPIVPRKGEDAQAAVRRPDGVQIKLRCAAPNGWLGKTDRARKQRVVLVKTRKEASAFEIVLVRRGGVLHAPADPSMTYASKFMDAPTADAGALVD